MNKKTIFPVIFVLVFAQAVQPATVSLSNVFELDGGLLDRDGDSLPDTVSLCILVPDLPTAQELALASDIAARANLESLVVDFSLVQRESSKKDGKPGTIFIHIGSATALAKAPWIPGGKTLARLEKHQGRVTLVSENGQNHIIVTAGSQETLLKTGRAFFLRWPYLWDIWGREEGETYQKLESDLEIFLKEAGSEHRIITVKEAAYEFAEISSPHDAIKRLRFNSGEIKNLRVEIRFPNRGNMDTAGDALEALRTGHKNGIQTDVLTYSGCSQITFELTDGDVRQEIEVMRVGYPNRMLTPSYKSQVRTSRTGRDFDLLSLFSSQGLFVDGNRDSHADGLEARMIIPSGDSPFGTQWLASRLVLDTTGAAFPLVYLDSEIENIKSISAPVLIGTNNLFVQELIKTAKLKIPPLKPGQGYIAVVPEAFHPSSVLAVSGADEKGLERSLAYLSQTFPCLTDYGQGEPDLQDTVAGVEEFLEGKRGAAEAYLSLQLEKTLEDLEDKEFESFNVEMFLPEKNPHFEKDLLERLKAELQTEELLYKSHALKDSKLIFEKQESLKWEREEALRLLEDNAGELKKSTQPLSVSIGLSESPTVRRALETHIKETLDLWGISTSRVEVLSSYKQGFFWINERIIPLLKDLNFERLLIRFAQEPVDLSEPKRFYSDPYRWLQELYPIDDIISQSLGIPLDRIGFEVKNETSPVYEFFALDKNGQILFRDSFTPRIREDFYMNILPEWGKVRLTTGWVTVTGGKKNILDLPLQSDLERFWDYYQTDILPEVHSYILKKTGNEPSFEKQPYFQRLLIELWLSEPDFRLSLDEELISSLESIHDEIYFDTLDFLRGITEVELEDESLAEDSSRFSAPGNILPLVHPSLEGSGGRVKVVFEDWQAQSPQLILKWKEKGKAEHTKKIVFPKIESGKMSVPGILYDGEGNNIEQLVIQLDVPAESDYTTLIDIFARCRELLDKKLLPDPFRYPNLDSIKIILKSEDLTKEEILRVSPAEKRSPQPSAKKTDEPLRVPEDEILSPQACLEISERLGSADNVTTYIAGTSFENRQIPVIEICTPTSKYTSVARLVAFKPTLYLTGRQHANEVSATNYILKFAELISTEKSYADYIRKINFVLHPMENPDGADLAYKLQEMTPEHSLHAGRYTSLGIDVGYQVGASRPLLPEAKVRGYLFDRWIPDIYLNLHGYPSHEWIQQFSGYAPFLFRGYWIPRGWFALYRSLTLPLYMPWKEAAADLKEKIVSEMTSDPDILDSNLKFYDRYFRWATRWQPHMNELEIYDGLNLYAKRRSSRESRLNSRRELTFVEETPELMDETASGAWLNFLVRQGLTYLWAHVKYLHQTEFTIVRIEEETGEQISIQFVRGRPGKKKTG